MTEVVFSLNINIANNNIKLPVLAGDTMSNIVERLFQMSSFPSHRQDSMANKLTSQLGLLVSTEKVSQKVKNKVASLLYQNSEKREECEMNRSQEGHFRILQDSLQQAKHANHCHQRKNFKYLQQEEPALHLQYPSEEIPHPLQDRRPSKSPLISRNTSKSPKYYRTSLPEQDLFALYLKKYEELDRKCDEYILKHIKNNKENLSSQPITNRNHTFYSPLHHRPMPLYMHRSYAPNDLDSKFKGLNLECLKRRTANTQMSPHQGETQRTTSESTGYTTMRARGGKKYNYLNVEP